MKAEVSSQEFKAILDTEKDLVVIDVRSPDEFKTGSIPGAMNIPLPELASRAKELRDKNVYLLCRSGGRSAIALKQLQALGFTNVSNILGGMTAWIKEGYPTNI